MKKILILGFTDLSRDPRLIRQMIALKDKYHITAVGTKRPDILGIRFIHYGNTSLNCIERWINLKYSLTNEFDKLYWKSDGINVLYKRLLRQKFDLIISNDIETLPLACKLNAKILYDAHEYAPKELEDIWSWRLFHQKEAYYLCEKYLPKADYRITVCKSIKKQYEKQFGINFDTVTNATNYKDIEMRKTDCNHIKIVHHGGAMVSRCLEKMIDIMKYTDCRFTLDLYLVGNEKYVQKLKKYSAGMKNISFKKPVKFDNIVDMLSNYDIGMHLMLPTNLNNEYALPNKFFEFVQARLAVAIGPSVEMKYYVDKFNCGVVSEDFDPKSLASALNKLTNQDIDLFKSNTSRLAKIQCAENNYQKLRKIIDSILEN